VDIAEKPVELLVPTQKDVNVFEKVTMPLREGLQMLMGDILT
jgi:hypothetical protein